MQVFLFGPFFALLGYKLNPPKARVPAEFGPGGKPDHLGKTTGSMNYSSFLIDVNRCFKGKIV